MAEARRGCADAGGGLWSRDDAAGGGREQGGGSKTSTPAESPPPSFSAPASSSPAAKAAFAAAEKALGSWRVSEASPRTLRRSRPPRWPTKSTWKGKTFLIDRPGLPQASVVLALPGVRLDDEDAPALDLLGGSLNSFGGRLFDGLRTERGLAYTVAARFDTGACPWLEERRRGGERRSFF